MTTDPKRPDGKMPRWVWLLGIWGIVILLILLAIGFLFGVNLGSWFFDMLKGAFSPR